MKAKKATPANEGNLIEIAFVDEKKVKGLHKPVVPPGKRWAERQVIPALDESGSLLPWKKFFYYKARLWVLLKEKPSAAAPWYFMTAPVLKPAVRMVEKVDVVTSSTPTAQRRVGGGRRVSRSSKWWVRTATADRC